MKTYDFGNGHTLTVEEGKRGYEDDYKIVFYEDLSKLYTEYVNGEYIEDFYGVKLFDEGEE